MYVARSTAVAFVFLLSCVAANAAVNPPSAPEVTASAFTVTWPGPNHNQLTTQLQERVPGGTWNMISSTSTGQGSIRLVRSVGTYEYRTRAVEEFFHNQFEPDIRFVFSTPITVNVIAGEPPVLPDATTQASYVYEVRQGDINYDGRIDAHVLRVTGDLNNGVLTEQVITRLSDNTFALFNATAGQLQIARSWPVSPDIDVMMAELNFDFHADAVIKGLPNANPQILVSSAVLFDGSAEQLGEFDDDSRLFARDMMEYVRDQDYFDQAQGADKDGYNIRIDGVIGFCYLFYGFPFCYQDTYVIADIDVTLEDLGLDSFLNVQSKASLGGTSVQAIGAYYSPDVHAAAEPILTEQGIADMHAHMDQQGPAMQIVGQYLPDISATPDVLRCVYWCGGIIRGNPYGFSYFYFVDTWTPITIPGQFDSENYSREAYDFSLEMDTVLANGWVQVATNPAVQRALERAGIAIGGAFGISILIEKIKDKIDEIKSRNSDDPVIDEAAQVILEEMIGAACVDVPDPEDCIEAVEDLFEEEVASNHDGDGLPEIVVIGSGNVDNDRFDEDYIYASFPILAEITRRLTNPNRWNCTYIKVKGNVSYYGRTSSPPGGGDCDTAVSRRDARHVLLNNAGFAPAFVKDRLTGPGSYYAVRGREQQLMDSYLVDGRTRGQIANIIRGVAKTNPLGCLYHELSDLGFGPLSPFTGWVDYCD